MARIEGPHYCQRCRTHRQVTAPWPHWTLVRRIYLSIPLLALPALPIMLADVFVMTPLFTFYLFGVGPVLGTRQLRMKCRDCGAVVDPLVARAEPFQIFKAGREALTLLAASARSGA